MKLIIYNINSFGGGYAYVNEIIKSARSVKEFENCLLLTPENSQVDGDGILKVLVTDKPGSSNKMLRKLHFIYRSFTNPLRLYKLLKREKDAVVLFNDFDQLSSFHWSFLLNKLRKRHLFGVILHDPDRDNYFPSKSLSAYTMKKVMSVMDVAFYHGFLPGKPYYKSALNKVEIPHGIYPAVSVDTNFESFIQAQKGNSYLIGVLGNIRDEKNYILIIEALQKLPNVKLLVAGASANSKVPTDQYLQKIKSLGLESRVIWVEKYLTENELAAAINVCDIVSLYYKETFTSQSGIINVIAPFKKKTIVSDTASSLKHVVAKYDLGRIVALNDCDKFAQAVTELLDTPAYRYDDNWSRYINEHSWHQNVTIIAESFKRLKKPM